jgi:ribosome recycling factor
MLQRLRNTSTTKNNVSSNYCDCRSFRLMSNHGAKKGLHLQHLRDAAHEKEHEAAVARRETKKEKNNARKGKNKPKGTENDNDDELDTSVAKGKNKSMPGNDAWNESHIDDADDEEDDHDRTVLPNPKEVKVKMMKHVESFRDYLKTLRGGGAPSVEMFDDVIVHDAYGRNTSHTMATATCFDPTTSKAVVVAIRDTLDLNPQAEEGTGAIQIPIPRISMEVRQQMVSTVQKRAEQFRVRIRNHRRSVLDTVKQGVAGKLEGVSKDDAFRVQQDIETMTDVVVKELNKLCEKKESDIMSV